MAPSNGDIRRLPAYSHPMQRLRATLRRYAALVAALLLCALLVRMAVPAGYMPEVAGGTIALTLCPATMPAGAAATPGMHHGKHEGGKPAQAEQPCAYASLAAPALAAADPLLLLAALVFAFLLALSPSPFRLAAPTRLRPPLRAPPILV